jgi:hypothetical protein
LLQFLQQLLRHDDTLGFTLAESFGFPVDLLREQHILFLYQCGRDETAELSLEKMKQPERIAVQLACIARARLSLILKRMQADPAFAIVMSVLQADLFTWILSDKPPLESDPNVEKLDLTPSLTLTNVLILKCLGYLAPQSEEFAKTSEMSVLVKNVIKHVTNMQRRK